MGIKIYNTLSKKKEDFKPVNEDNITMYVCGPTVYSNPHIGNARSALVGDLWYRILKNKYKKVTYIRNITDVDDKIIDAAKKENRNVNEITEKYYKTYKSNMDSLTLLDPTHEPKVTDFIPRIIEIITKIISSGYTYTSEGNVMFDTVKYTKYGKLSKRIAKEMLDGVRIDVASYKKSPKDFILWKPSHKDQLGWDSPWGYGRPGWHIECTSMIKEIIGHDSTLDIHGGGNDLIFPHHENELAQGNCVSKNEYCNYWFHNGIVLVNKKKMSKSLGNVVLIEDLLKNTSPISIKYALLSSHYRQPLNWTSEVLNNSINIVTKYKNLISEMKNNEKEYIPDNELVSILEDDLNTPAALNYISTLVKNINNNKSNYSKFLFCIDFLGLNIVDDISNVISEIDNKIVEQLIKERNVARLKKNFNKADLIRKKLSSLNVEIKDDGNQTVWKFKPK
ncbi:MAG: cysteine--tRNA ligase [Gammaproteobacteria bacterium]|nr:cysteine--tRNA ligase [Gammaproteobacteria bacterium]|tara:strand:+ start:111841 stop:113190 length:1350 start_codon:yes stop_codon:yes gene_type:complete